MKADERTRLSYEVDRRARRGESDRAIARALCIDRRTVKKLRLELLERRARGDDALARELGPPATPRASKLDSHREYIQRRLEKAPKLRVTTLLRELKRRGYTGGYTILREHVNRVRPQPAKKAAVRVDHPPGRQAQADWSPYRSALVGEDKPSEWGCVLSYSKFSYRHFRLDERQPTIFREIVRSLEAFGGVPDEIVFDSMSGIVDRWEIGEPILNVRAIDFAAYYGFTLHIAPRGQGQYKGIVEHIFLDTQNQLLDGDPTFCSLEALNAACARWMHEQNRRIHATTKRRPIDLLAVERPLLGPLPAKPYDTRDLAYRIPDGYGRVHFDGNRYTVPPSYVGRMVYVRADDERVEIFDGQATRIAEHERQARGADVDVTDRAHRVVR